MKLAFAIAGTAAALCNNDELQPLAKHATRAFRTLSTAITICLDYRELQAEGEVASVEMKQACHARSADRLYHLCATNGGLYIKMAQQLVSLGSCLPEEYGKRLEGLQDQAPAENLETVTAILKKELGDAYDAFSFISPAPIGAASIGQVHLGKLKTGEQVAIKVQRPTIKEDSVVDLWTLRRVTDIIRFFWPQQDFDWMADEMEKYLVQELSFTAEAKNARTARIAFGLSQKDVQIPLVHEQLSTDRVLTMQFCPGIKINDRRALVAAGIDPYVVTELLYQVFTEMFFEHEFMHCDPHPGNVLVRVDEEGKLRIVLLDHGLYTKLSANTATQLARMLIAMALKDHAALAKLLGEFGMSAAGASDLERLLSDACKCAVNDPKAMLSLLAEMDAVVTRDDNTGERALAGVLAKLPSDFRLVVRILSILQASESSLHLSDDPRLPNSVRVLAERSVAYMYRKSISQANGSFSSRAAAMQSYLYACGNLRAAEFVSYWGLSGLSRSREPTDK